MNAFSPSAFAPYFRVRLAAVVISNIVPTRIAVANSARVLLVIPSSTTAYTITPGVPGAGITGINIPANSAPYEITYAAWGGIVGGEWWVPTIGFGPVTLTFTEVWYDPGV